MKFKIQSKTHGVIEVQYDECDKFLIKKHNWAVTRIGYNLYVLASVKKLGKWTKEYLHRMILTPPKGLEIDHINRDSLDNRRINLRIVTRSINALNREKIGESGFANANKVNNRYRSMIRFEGKHFHGGYFDTPEEAHKKSMDMKKEIYDRLTGHS